MRLFIPTIGTQIKLIQDWDFTLHCEHRNFSLINHFKVDPDIKDQWDCYSYKRGALAQSWKARLEARTVLRIDRIYIRKGKDDFDSISFIVTDSPDKIMGTKQNKCSTMIRFWAKLDDVNNIDCELLEGRMLV